MVVNIIEFIIALVFVIWVFSITEIKFWCIIIGITLLVKFILSISNNKLIKEQKLSTVKKVKDK